MDVVASITSITAQVLRKLADGIEAAPVEDARPTVHIENMHVHCEHEATPDVTPRFPRLHRGR
jgi:hypothetical protein